MRGKKEQNSELKFKESDFTETKYWKLYEKGIEYIQGKNLITRTNRCWDFYSGNQWKHAETGGEELPFFNFIKPTIKHKVSTVSQNNMVAHYSDAEGREDMAETYAKFDAVFSEDWEKANMDMQLWAFMKDSAVTGDGILYFGTGRAKDVQRLPNTAVLYGNESEQDIQKQPYLIIHQRLSVKTIKEEARVNGVPEELVATIISDKETENVIGNTDEVEYATSSDKSKATTIIYMTKKDGVLHIAKAVKNLVYVPLRPVEATNQLGDKRSMTLYPLVKVSWEDYPNSARGISEVEQLIPNQLELNKTLARRSIIITQTAYSRLAYDATVVQNPEDLNKVGAPIELNSGGIESVNQAIQYLQPAQSNSDPKHYSDDLLSITQELSGSGETAMGNINPNRVAASAIIAIRDQAALPLNEQQAKMKTAVEDLAMLWLEMKAVFEPEGFNVVAKEIDPRTGQQIQRVVEISKEELDNLKPSIRIDTSQDTPWTKEAEQNWLDMVLEKGYIDFSEYISASPEHGIVPKNKMETILRMRQQAQMQQQQQQQMQQQAMEQMAMQEAQAVVDAEGGKNDNRGQQVRQMQ